MRSGIRSAQDDGRQIAFRDELYGRMENYAEGTFFRQSEIVMDAQEAASFAELRDYDYVHVSGGLFTRIIETPRLRRLPYVPLVLRAYEDLKSLHLVETGDRTAWKSGLKVWEPIEGYRYYTDGADDLLSLGRIKIKIIAAPAWARSDAADARLFRCLYDQPHKDAIASMERIGPKVGLGRSDLIAAADFGYSVPRDCVPTGWKSPGEVSDLITHFLEQGD